jgi:hypothetical protein
MTSGPYPSVKGLQIYLDAYLKLFREFAVSVEAMRSAAAEVIPGFEEAYSRHHKAANASSLGLPNPEALARISKDFHQLTEAVVRLLVEK